MTNERKSIISVDVDEASGLMVFNVAGIGSIRLDTEQLADDIRARGMFHGIEQKVRDAGAIPRDTKTGQSATPGEKFDAMKAVAENLLGGVWNAVRTGTKAVLNRAALFQAIAQVKGVEASKVEAKFRDRPDDVLKTFLGVAEIAGAYAALTVKRSGEMAESLLGELED